MAIIKESIKKLAETFSFSPVLRQSEDIKGMKGKLFMRAYEGGELVYDYASPNVIVSSAGILLARLLKDSSEPSKGISYLAVGTGAIGWDIQNPPAPTIDRTLLRAELSRKAISPSHTTFVDPITGDPVSNSTPTNVVDYSVTFSESEAVGAIVEMSLFGGDATSAANSGTMVNYRTFPVLNKTNSMTLSVIFRITT